MKPRTQRRGQRYSEETIEGLDAPWKPLPPSSPHTKDLNKRWYDISPYVSYADQETGKRPSSNAALGWHDLHSHVLTESTKLTLLITRNRLFDWLPDFPGMLEALRDCTGSKPCGRLLCPYCNISVAVRNATLIGQELGIDPESNTGIAFTLQLDELTEQEFQHQVMFGEAERKEKKLDNLCNARFCSHNLSMRFKKHIGLTPMLLMPDVDYNPKTKTYNLHYHGLVRSEDSHIIKVLKEKYPGRVTYSKKQRDLWKYVLYGHKFPTMKFKHTKEMKRIQDEYAWGDTSPKVLEVNRLLMLWKACAPPNLYLNFSAGGDRSLTGSLRSNKDYLCAALSWRRMNHTE